MQPLCYVLSLWLCWSWPYPPYICLLFLRECQPRLVWTSSTIKLNAKLQYMVCSWALRHLRHKTTLFPRGIFGLMYWTTKRYTSRDKRTSGRDTRQNIFYPCPSPSTVSCLTEGGAPSPEVVTALLARTFCILWHCWKALLKHCLSPRKAWIYPDCFLLSFLALR